MHMHSPSQLNVCLAGLRDLYSGGISRHLAECQHYNTVTLFPIPNPGYVVCRSTTIHASLFYIRCLALWVMKCAWGSLGVQPIMAETATCLRKKTTVIMQYVEAHQQIPHHAEYWPC
jgi:hypothetical protein